MQGRLFQGMCLVNSTNGTTIVTVPQIPTVLALWESRWQNNPGTCSANGRLSNASIERPNPAACAGTVHMEVSVWRVSRGVSVCISNSVKILLGFWVSGFWQVPVTSKCLQVVPRQAGGGSFKFETLIAYRAEQRLCL